MRRWIPTVRDPGFPNRSAGSRDTMVLRCRERLCRVPGDGVGFSYDEPRHLLLPTPPRGRLTEVVDIYRPDCATRFEFTGRILKSLFREFAPARSGYPGSPPNFTPRRMIDNDEERRRFERAARGGRWSVVPATMARIRAYALCASYVTALSMSLDIRRPWTTEYGGYVAEGPAQARHSHVSVARSQERGLPYDLCHSSTDALQQGISRWVGTSHAARP